MKKSNMSHNACSVYDYSACRWNLQPGDMVSFDDRENGVSIGEVVSLSSELLFVRRLSDRRGFIITTYDMRDWRVRRVDHIRRLPNGVFSLGERVFLDGELNFGCSEYVIDKFERDRVKIRYSTKGRFVGCFWVLGGEVLKYEE